MPLIPKCQHKMETQNETAISKDPSMAIPRRYSMSLHAAFIAFRGDI